MFKTNGAFEDISLLFTVQPPAMVFTPWCQSLHACRSLFAALGSIQPLTKKAMNRITSPSTNSHYFLIINQHHNQIAQIEFNPVIMHATTTYTPHTNNNTYIHHTHTNNNTSHKQQHITQTTHTHTHHTHRVQSPGGMTTHRMSYTTHLEFRD